MHARSAAWTSFISPISTSPRPIDRWSRCGSTRRARSGGHRATQFDFIIVSGDLTQAATVEQYAELHAFSEATLLPLVRPGAGGARDRARVLFIPGNHDVSWATEIGDPWRFASLRGDGDLRRLEEELRKLRTSPEDSDLRLEVSRFGHLELLRLKPPEQYALRMKNVGDFLARFYAGARHKAMDLSQEGQDWSAHVFADEKVAFYGFNSCHRNDRYWTGAYINPASVANAAAHARALPAGTLLVAVWHHGLAAERGRPDYLTVEDVGMLYSAGFRVGFHGHTHRAAVKSIKVLDDRFAIISTGTLGAGQTERPDAVGNQFSIAQVYPNRVIVRLFERDGAQNVYDLHQTRRLAFDASSDDGREERVSSAAHHARTFTIGAGGIATVDVVLSDFQVSGDASLAMVHPPYCNVEADGDAEVGHRPLPVREERLDDGRIRYTLAPGGGPFHPRLTWSYRISASVALNQAELELLDKPDPWFPKLGRKYQGYDVRAHTPRFDCDRLTLRLAFTVDSGATIAHALPMVERRVERGGEADWEPIESEEARCQFRFGERDATLEIDAPIVGYRYSIAWQPGARGVQFRPQAEALATTLLRQCRGRPQVETSLAPLLTRTVARALTQDLAADAAPRTPGTPTPLTVGRAFGERGSWMGSIWDFTRRRLFPAFGQFRPQAWSACFPCGVGLAGHAFRFATIAAWNRDTGGIDAAGGTSIIYQEDPAHHLLYHHKNNFLWIVCVPLLLARGGPAIGVVSLASEEAGTPLEKGLYNLSMRSHLLTGQPDEHLSPPDRVELARLERYRDQLLTTLNSAFWTSLASDENGRWLPKGDQEYARQIAEAIQK